MYSTTLLLALAAAGSTSAQSISTSTCIIRHLTGAASYLQALQTDLPTNFNQDIVQFVPGATQFLQQSFPSATNLGQVVSSIAAAAPSLLPQLLNLVPSGALDPVELAAASSQASAIGVGLASDVNGLLGAFPTDLPVTSLSSFINANSAAVSSEFVAGVNQAFPQAITALLSLESSVYPTGIPPDTSGALPQCFATSSASAKTTIATAGQVTSSASVNSSAATTKASATSSIAKGAAPTMGASFGLIGSAALAGVIGIAAAVL